MPIEYGFNCICGAEYDLGLSTAEALPHFTCRKCGRLISTGFGPAPAVVSLAPDLSTDKLREEIPHYVSKMSVDRSPNGTLEKARLKWEASKVPGERADRQVVLRRLEHADGVEWEVEFFSAPFEGRHMTRDYRSRFDSYSEAVEQCLSFVRPSAEEADLFEAELRRDL